ncbi:MAG: BNR-4 repeat-containing protein [Mariniphaga sp.]
MKYLILILICWSFAASSYGQSLNNTKMDGYRGIWFELNQKYEFGDKYSGALGTYTAKHVPLAVYSDKADKTFFVYGGTKAEDERYLLCMIGEFDHKTGRISKPTVVYDKLGINDPHDNPSVMIDDNGFIHVFVSGRGRSRPGFKFRSVKPYEIDAFEQISEEEMTYPQPWNTRKGYLHLFTKYTGIRQLYFESSEDGVTWTEDQLLAAIPENEGERSGHYQTSASFDGKKVGTFFNRHPDGNVDKRTDIYYVETTDLGRTWRDVKGNRLEIPLLKRESRALVVDYRSQEKNVYLKDMGFDSKGNPAFLYIRSNGHEPGPGSAPYEWCVTRWDGKKWHTSVVTESDHNYDMGSLYISKSRWNIVAPAVSGPQKWGVGGELEVWESTDRGNIWQKQKTLTQNSRFNHAYVRRPVGYKAPFCFFWADGHPHEFSKSQLYFGDFEGNIWRLPYDMKEDFAKPEKL